MTIVLGANRQILINHNPQCFMFANQVGNIFNVEKEWQFQKAYFHSFKLTLVVVVFFSTIETNHMVL